MGPEISGPIIPLAGRLGRKATSRTPNRQNAADEVISLPDGGEMRRCSEIASAFEANGGKGANPREWIETRDKFQFYFL